MFSGSDSISRYSRLNVLIWSALAFQAGMLNIGGFMACHRFVSHVTGFATFFGHEMSRRHFVEALGMLSVPLFFLLGAILSGILVDSRIRADQRPRYVASFGLIFGLIMAIFVGGVRGAFGPFGEPLVLARDYFLLALLCLVCGLQNGTISIVSRSIVRTTHLTGITTDLGLGLVRVFNRSKLISYDSHEARWIWIRVSIIFSFCAGSVMGGFGFSEWGYFGFILPLMTAGFLLLGAVWSQFAIRAD